MSLKFECKNVELLLLLNLFHLITFYHLTMHFSSFRLFRDGHINWGRIITLLCFGYRMAVTVVQRGIRGFFSNVVGFVVRFIINEKIAQWIAEQGGWVSRAFTSMLLGLEVHVHVV